MKKLYVVTCVFNPENYQSRYDLYNNFEKYIKSFDNVELYTVELAFNDQEFKVTKSNDPQHIQLRTNEILWFKENLLNIGIKALPADAKYVGWIDADIEFENINWIQDTCNKLDEYPFIQMFKRANDLGPNGEIIGNDRSFIQRWETNDYDEKRRGRSGLAWAATMDALKTVDYLIDWGIVGSADWFMAFSLTGQLTAENLNNKTGGYSGDALKIWDDKIQIYPIDKRVSYIDGTVNHFWHGKKSDRGYNWRWKILSENEFNPITDMGYRDNGLIQVVADKPKLHEDIIDYFKSRKEDSIEK